MLLINIEGSTKINELSIASFAPDVKCPVFISLVKREREKWDKIYENISAQKSFFCPKKGGAHGSKALWEKKKNKQIAIAKDSRIEILTE